jgi:histidinol-phosphate phosphatase family protein
MKALFLDRDGTLFQNTHYLVDHSDISWLPGVLFALKEMQRKGYLILVVSNQSGIGRGYFTKDQVISLHKKVLNDLRCFGINCPEIRFCPHRPNENCHCRKPKPFMLVELAKKYNLTLNESIMLGDQPSDLQCGHNAGVKSYQLHPNKFEWMHWWNKVGQFI